MGIKEFKILFDNPVKTYVSGEIVTGRILLDLDSPKKCRGIKIKVKGKASTQWEESSGDKNDTYTGREKYFSSKFYIVGGVSQALNLNPTKHIFPFQYVLPPNLPSSFEWKKTTTKAHIRYTVEAIIDCAWQMDDKTKAAFTVLSNYDLNADRFAFEPVFMKDSKSFGLLSSSFLSIHVSLPVRGYVPGQLIPIKLNFYNSSKYEVYDVKLKLKMYAKFSTTSRNRKTKPKMTLMKVHLGRIERKTSSLVHEFRIPPLPPSNTGSVCKIISFTYAIKLEAAAGSMLSRNLKMSTPIVIGSIPLVNYQSHGTPSSHTTKPPTYEESMFAAENIPEEDDVTGKKNFAPRYPVYNFSTFS